MKSLLLLIVFYSVGNLCEIPDSHNLRNTDTQISVVFSGQLMLELKANTPSK